MLVVGAVGWLAPAIPARFQCLLWRLAILKFVIALVWTVPIEVPILSGIELSVVSVASDVLLGGAALAAETPILSEVTSHRSPLLLLPLALWGVGVAWQLARILTAHRAARRLRSQCCAIEDRALLDLAWRMSHTARLARAPLVLATNGRGSPLAVGLFSPAIVLPSGTLARLDDAERALVMGHEVAHIARRDLLWNLSAAIVRSCFFFHPLAWFCERQLHLAQEIAADEMAIKLQQQDPVDYAAHLVSIVGKFGRSRAVPQFSARIAGYHRSLHKRLFAMKLMKHRSALGVRIFSRLLACCAMIGMVPWTLVTTTVTAAEPTAAATQKSEPTLLVDASAQQEIGKGTFISFANGVLTIEGMIRPSATNKGATGVVAWKNIDESTKVYLASGEDNGPDRGYKQAPTLATLSQVKPGTPVFVGPWFGYKDRPGVFIGVTSARTVGTFVSYTTGSKNSGLTLLGKNLSPSSFTKKYGNNLFIRGIAENIPVEESVDGGPYRSVGTVKTVLPDVKEGTVVTLHFLGEGNITLVQLGETKAK